MMQHNLIQGSPEWHQFRAEHFGASEAAAMLGLSPYMSRNDLLKAKATGITKDVDAATQRIFDRGHEVEALARPIIEAQIGDDLYPVTASSGRLSASCDGLTMCGAIAWENKQFNAKLFAAIQSGELPEHHWPQVQQVLYVTGAEKLIFTCSDGTPENTASMDIYPDAELHKTLTEGWAQFEKDLAEYAHTEVIEPTKAEAIKDLPAVTIQVKGELTTCNLDSVKPYFDKFLSEAKMNLVTDDDFAQAEAEAKLGRETAKRCKLTAKAVVDQMLSISEVTRTLEEYAAKFDALALRQEKAVKEQKEARKASAKLERDKAFAEHIAALNDEIKPITLVLSSADKPDFVGAMKNRRTLESLYNKLDTELARAKIAADSAAKLVRMNLNLINGQPSYKFLFNDAQQLVYKDFDDLKLLVDSRIEQHEKAEAERLENEREKIRLEEEVKAAAKVKAEQERIASENLAEQRRIEREEFDKRQESELLAAEQLKASNPEPAKHVKQAEVEHVVEQLIDTAKTFHQEKPIKGGNVTVEMVTIPKSEYDKLCQRSTWLSCLEDAGVDNWPGIDHAKEMLEELQVMDK